LVFLVTEGPNGMALNTAHQPMEFGAMKKMFRAHIDGKYDHHLILNETDPWAQLLYKASDSSKNDHGGFEFDGSEAATLPGLTTVPGDPTVENMAKWIAEWSCSNYRCDVICRIDETKTNGAEVMFHWNNFGASMVRGAT
jgi:6-pyruvoyl-tetrahydropterin synthase